MPKFPKKGRFFFPAAIFTIFAFLLNDYAVSTTVVPFFFDQKERKEPAFSGTVCTGTVVRMRMKRIVNFHEIARQLRRDFFQLFFSLKNSQNL